MIMIFSTLVLNDDISRYSFDFFEIFIFWAVRGVKGESIAQYENKNYIRLAPHLWNSIEDDYYFLYTSVK